MEVKVLNINKELADKMLALNTKNRKVKSRTVDVYAKDMTEGRWKENGVPIVIGYEVDELGNKCNYVLKDGQHRLLAISKSGFTAENTIVVYQANEKATAYDIGSPRSIKDIAAFSGNDVANYSPYILYAFSFLILDANNGLMHSRISKLETIEYAEKNKEVSKFVSDNYVTKNGTKTKGLRSSALVAALITAYLNGVSEQDMLNICEVLRTGVMKNAEDETIIRLRNYFINKDMSSGRTNQKKQYLTALNLIRNYENRVIIKVVRQPSVASYPNPLSTTKESVLNA